MLRKFFLLLFLFSTISCGGWQDFEGALSGQKKRTTDEYLIKKKDPLILPPDYDKLPLPESKKVENEEKNRIETILSDQPSSKGASKSQIEMSVGEELRKKN